MFDPDSDYDNFYMHMAIAISVTSDAQGFDEGKRDRCDCLALLARDAVEKRSGWIA